MKNIVILIVTLVVIAGCSTTNKYDVEIAKERFKYGKIVNERKPMFEIKGELRCTDEQKASGQCGLVVYNQNQRYINVEPQSPDRYGQTLNFLGKIANPFFQFKINETNNEYGYLRQLSSDSLFSNMFEGLANAKNTGTTTNISDSYNDSSTHSSIQDSYNSADTNNTDSYNTSTSSTVSDSHNQSSSSTSSSSTETNTTTSGDTDSNNKTENNTTNNEGQTPSE